MKAEPADCRAGDADADAKALFALAAKVFGVPHASLSPETSRSSIPEWDSVNHLRLVMEAEKEFGVSWTLAEIAQLATLGDFLHRLRLPR